MAFLQIASTYSVLPSPIIEKEALSTIKESEKSLAYDDNYLTELLRFPSLLGIISRVPFIAGDDILQLGIGLVYPDRLITRHCCPQLVEILSVMPKSVRLISVDNNLKVLTNFQRPDGFEHEEGKYFKLSSPLYYPKKDYSGKDLLPTFLNKFVDSENSKEKTIESNYISENCLIYPCNFETFPFHLYENIKCIVATQSIKFVFRKFTEEHSEFDAEILCLNFLKKISYALVKNGVLITTSSDFECFPECSQLSMGIKHIYSFDKNRTRYHLSNVYNFGKMVRYLNDKLGHDFCVDTVIDRLENTRLITIARR
ncbi:hypothetical protein D5R81_09715 [Parashewanella spongiae]|uniref:Uncharacterized protein n=1 Tax=Parashewanella spongiae TaxID=342950 RepID=A0A3A6TX56_9GAMM|nr:hypothetical protein [Parashewanella spongiae]MCL1078659.1 hypothetical protein [Parashewanella spongiae]RJY16306.1 hypothetical protein D5R81_09715 [Parashewanella spongiae]